MPFPHRFAIFPRSAEIPKWFLFIHSSVLYALFWILALLRAVWDRDSFSPWTAMGTEAQSGQGTYPGSHRWHMTACDSILVCAAVRSAIFNLACCQQLLLHPSPQCPLRFISKCWERMAWWSLSTQESKHRASKRRDGAVGAPTSQPSFTSSLISLLLPCTYGGKEASWPHLYRPILTRGGTATKIRSWKAPRALKCKGEVVAPPSGNLFTESQKRLPLVQQDLLNAHCEPDQVLSTRNSEKNRGPAACEGGMCILTGSQACNSRHNDL